MTVLGVCAVSGCSTPSQTPAVEVALATTAPSEVAVRADDFERLWSSADLVARDLLFVPARQDRRAGLYVTEPMGSAQWFEPWRTETRSIADRAQSSLGSIRRTLTVRVERDPAGGFVARPSVAVKRFALAERRVTTAAGYRSVFRDRNLGYGSIETDAGLELPGSYWYAIGNDPDLETHVARAIERRLRR